MEWRAFGPTKFRVPVIGQGTWHLEEDDRRLAITALRLGLDLDMTHIDTAELYGDGVVEQIVGEAIAGRRDDVFLVSKVLPQHATRQGTIEACEGSLARLRTDHLDGYLLHWPSEHPLRDTVEAFEALQRDGKILSWGLSNFDVPDLDAAARIAGEGRIACNQVLYNVQQRAIEHAVGPWDEQHRIATVAYAPLGSGRFPGPRTKGGRVLREIADAHGATPRQVALRWVVRQPSVFAIAKAAKPEHTAENAATADLSLTAREIARIDEAFPLGRRPRTLPTL
jgi:diketogulonate reductase-like aldo/keto reductase